MKKIWFFPIVVLVIMGFSNPIYADEHKAHFKKKIYATSEEILFDMLRPSISKFVNDNYGHDVSWNDPSITEVKCEVAENNMSYIVSMLIKVDVPTNQQHDSSGLDKLTLRIDSTRNESNKSKNESNIMLIEYTKLLTPNMQ
ncbi:DUF3888 domain-containing protein [Paenibacillus sp. N4]|uniref:DUF3888 domain-containing protein n=1 Tax=Paenibacillus vietnamensis TaxID=2590547 RepID=UPI001CD07306|nr:DUF3888 domain-containing protein [Paenibacillus vietnamensis]MCA0757263.1 DUF3888 domain-containing protein [Paenibacillus vietnamensis]